MMRLPAAVFGGLVSVLLAGADTVCVAQEQAAPPPKDTIFARKILMGTIGMNMDEIEGMLEPGGKFDPGEAREHADLISVLLMTFPHMFPAATNQWKAGADRDAALDTFAAPELWSNFSDFYGRATAASKFAFDASRAATFKDFKARMEELRTTCDGCHLTYMKSDN
jgi:cytochrome c556